MRILISIETDDDGTALDDLYRWFRQDGDLRRHAEELRLRPVRHTGGFMGSLDVIELIVGQAIAAANLAIAYATWRHARGTQAPMTITANGVSITVQDGSEDSVRRIVELLGADSAGEAGSSAADTESSVPDLGSGSASNGRNGIGTTDGAA